MKVCHDVQGEKNARYRSAFRYCKKPAMRCYRTLDDHLQIVVGVFVKFRKHGVVLRSNSLHSLRMPILRRRMARVRVYVYPMGACNPGFRRMLVSELSVR